MLFGLVSEFSPDDFSGIRKNYGFELSKEKNSYELSLAEIFRILVMSRKTFTYWYNFTSTDYMPGMILNDSIDLYQ